MNALYLYSVQLVRNVSSHFSKKQMCGSEYIYQEEEEEPQVDYLPFPLQ